MVDVNTYSQLTISSQNTVSATVWGETQVRLQDYCLPCANYIVRLRHCHILYSWATNLTVMRSNSFCSDPRESCLLTWGHHCPTTEGRRQSTNNEILTSMLMVWKHSQTTRSYCWTSFNKVGWEGAFWRWSEKFHHHQAHPWNNELQYFSKTKLTAIIITLWSALSSNYCTILGSLQ